MSNGNDDLILYFTATWCDPCKKTRPIVEDLNIEQEFVRFFIIDVDDATQMTKDFEVLSYPTFVLIKNGKEISRIVGQQNREGLEDMIKHYEQ
jgi:thioredoxin 1